ncbi:hypothetical protein ABTX85_37455 [Streptomyces sp. NPDC096097]|uniref:hypothetical protein n=1 Tax=Streptomyces sp. NPDC096097 TaxID=3155546 RepID=UPI00332AB1BF
MVASTLATVVAVAGMTLGGAAAAHADVGDITYTDFLDGRITFTQTEDTKVQMVGQFNDGLNDPNALCLIYPGDLAPVPMNAVINPPGTAPFEHDFTGVTIKDFTGISVRVICDSELIGESDPTAPVGG